MSDRRCHAMMVAASDVRLTWDDWPWCGEQVFVLLLTSDLRQDDPFAPRPLPDDMVSPIIDALAAQAVAARTYALKNMGRFNSEGFDLTADERTQVYGGASAEKPVPWTTTRAPSTALSGLTSEMVGRILREQARRYRRRRRARRSSTGSRASCLAPY